MADTVFISITGPVFAFLLYENINSSGNQQGFFLGDISENKILFATDTDITNISVDKIINIRDVLPCPHIDEFYNNVGIVDEDKLKYFLKDKRKQVIGWFHFRRNTSCMPFVREKLVHKELCSIFDVPPELFSICILTSYMKNSSSLNLVHSFFRYNYINFEKIAYQVQNLGDADNLYNSYTASKDFDILISKVLSTSKKLKDIHMVNKILTFIETHLHNLVEKVSKVDNEVFCLETENKNLNIQIKQIKCNKLCIQGEKNK